MGCVMVVQLCTELTTIPAVSRWTPHHGPFQYLFSLFSLCGLRSPSRRQERERLLSWGKGTGNVSCHVGNGWPKAFWLGLQVHFCTVYMYAFTTGQHCCRRRSEHIDRNVKLKPTVIFRTSPTHQRQSLLWCYRKTFLYNIVAGCYSASTIQNHHGRY